MTCIYMKPRLKSAPACEFDLIKRTVPTPSNSIGSITSKGHASHVPSCGIPSLWTLRIWRYSSVRKGVSFYFLSRLYRCSLEQPCLIPTISFFHPQFFFFSLPFDRSEQYVQVYSRVAFFFPLVPWNGTVSRKDELACI